MARAHGITVFRGGVTAPSVRREREAGANLYSDWYYSGGRQVRGAVISFSIDSKGGGKTQLRVVVEPSEFEHLARIMMDTDARAARAAFKSASSKIKTAARS